MVGNVTVIYKEEKFLSYRFSSQKMLFYHHCLEQEIRRGADDSHDPPISGLSLSPPSATSRSGFLIFSRNSKPVCGQGTSLALIGPGPWSVRRAARVQWVLQALRGTCTLRRDPLDPGSHGASAPPGESCRARVLGRLLCGGTHGTHLAAWLPCTPFSSLSLALPSLSLGATPPAFAGSGAGTSHSPQVSASQSSPATCWPPVVVTLGEATLVGPARPGFHTLHRTGNHFSETALPVVAKAHRLADLQLSPEASSGWSPTFPGPHLARSPAQECEVPGSYQDASCPGLALPLRQPWGRSRLEGIAGKRSPHAQNPHVAVVSGEASVLCERQGGRRGQTPPTWGPCSAVRQWSRETPGQPVQLELSCPWAERCAQAYPISFLLGEVPGSGWTGSMGHLSQKSEAKVRELQSAGEGSAFSLEVLALSAHDTLSPNIVGEQFCSEEVAS